MADDIGFALRPGQPRFSLVQTQPNLRPEPPRLQLVPEDRLAELKERTRYDPGQVEPRILREWLEAGYFHPPATGTPAENYSIVIPPPNVTGELHMGHALNGTMQDMLARTRRMQGRNTLWVLGTDHAGIATQVVVEKQLAGEGLNREQIGREAFERRVWEWRERYGSRIVEQYKRLGASCDYERERFTMDEAYVRAVYKVFKALYEKDYIYRDYYMVNWDPAAGTAISDLEVEHREVEDTLYYIDYPLASGEEGHVTVATVRPETMLADTAVAVHPSDERYSGLVGATVILPLVGRRLPVIVDDHVDPEFGTGALKITPGHDPHDFEIGRRHELEEISVIGEDGRLTEAAGERFAGQTVAEARATVVAALDEIGAVSRREPYVHSVGYSERSGQPIEPLISLQWFCRMDELAAPAIEAVEQDRVRIVPADPWKRVMLDWMRNIRPWCISRQLWWGHRLPVWYCDTCEETYVSETPPERCGLCEEEARQESDVLDTWFSSQLWPFAALGWPDETPELKAFYPTDFLTTAREILYLWVARMIMMGLEFARDIPFEDVYVHSVILAPDGRRMSKSLGTGIDPLEAVDEQGADALRFGLMAMSSSQDVRYSAKRVEQGLDLANKMWNASRLVLLNVAPVAPAARPETVEDRWILSRLQRVIAQVTERIEAYDFSHAALDLYSFFWSELCDWYLEVVKPRLYGEEPSAGDGSGASAGRDAVSATLLYVLEETLALAHPIMPFVTEEIYGFMPHAEGHLAVRRFPSVDEGLIDEGAEREMEAVIEATRRLRNYRDSVGAAASARIPARVVVEEAGARELYERSLATIRRLSRFELEVAGDGRREEVEAGDGAGGRPAAAGAASDRSGAVITIPGGSVELLTSDAIDPEQAQARIAERTQKLRSEIERARGKLANQSFVEKAPADVVQQERDKLERFERELAELER
jgi:valyl-tRNA synthetase